MADPLTSLELINFYEYENYLLLLDTLTPETIAKAVAALSGTSASTLYVCTATLEGLVTILIVLRVCLEMAIKS